MKAGLAVKLDPTKRGADAIQFDQALRQRLIGQEEAIIKMTEIYQLFKAGLCAPGRPVGNLLFLGTTGSGKTRAFEAMCEALFGDVRAGIKIDCAEFQHSHEVAKLIGSPPGYLGHRETHPILTQEAINQWHTEKIKLSLLLFDEIEKASDSLWKLMLGIMDKATLTLGDNRRVDLSSCIIVMTSNLGAAQMSELIDGPRLGFGPKTVTKEASNREKIVRIATDAVKKKFDPEFMNRIDKMVVFNTLSDSDLAKILELELRLIQTRIFQATAANQFVFKCTDEVKAFLLKEGTDPKYGARPLKRALEKNLVFPMANLVATGQVKLGDFIEVTLGAPELTFTKLAEGATMPIRTLPIGGNRTTDTALRNIADRLAEDKDNILSDQS